MANTPEVDNWLAATNGLTVAAIQISGGITTDADTLSMMRQVQTGCVTLLAALQRIPQAITPTPPPGEGATGAVGHG